MDFERDAEFQRGVMVAVALALVTGLILINILGNPAVGG